MNGLIPAGIGHAIGKFTKEHTSDLLFWTGLTGLAGTAVLAAYETPAALKALEQKRQEEERSELTFAETIQTASKYYIRPLITGGFSAFCLIMAHRSDSKKAAALATAYGLTETAYSTYREKTKELVGEKKEGEIRDSVAKEHADTKAPVILTDVIITGYGHTVCMDSATGRLFYGDADKLRSAAETINRRLRNDMFVPLNEFYDEIGLDRVNLGDDVGFDVDKGYLDLYLSAQLARDGKTPMLVALYSVYPRPRYL